MKKITILFLFISVLASNSIQAEKTLVSKIQNKTLLKDVEKQNDSVSLFKGKMNNTIDLSKIRKDIRMKSNALIGDTKKLITNEALNDFYARKAAHYLFNSSDIALSRNYFVLNTEEGRMTLGHSFIPCWNTSDRIRHLINVSFATETKDDFSTIYKENKYTNNIGIGFKYTLLGDGSFKFNSTIPQTRREIAKLFNEGNNHKIRMNERVKIIRSETYYNMELDSIKLYNTIKDIDEEEIRNKIIEKYYKKKDYIKQFDKSLSKQLDDGDYYNVSVLSWFSLEGYIPITPTIYNISSSSDLLLQDMTKEKFRMFEAGVSWTQLRQWKKYGNLMFSINPKIYYNNLIKIKDLKEITIIDYKNLGGTDTLMLKKLGDRSAYIGDFETFWTPSIRGKLIYFFPNFEDEFLKSILFNTGISVSIEQMFGKYNPLNVQIGIPFSLKGEDKDSPVNFELQFKFADFDGDIQPDKSRMDKMVIGFSLGLPFGDLSK